MESLRELFRIGNGPSSSHSLGPRAAMERFCAAHPQAAAIDVVLYGSLAATGRGHHTDRALEAGASGRPIRIDWQAGDHRGCGSFHSRGGCARRPLRGAAVRYAHGRACA